jgi:hypothetical protein
VGPGQGGISHSIRSQAKKSIPREKPLQLGLGPIRAPGEPGSQEGQGGGDTHVNPHVKEG